MPRSRIGVRKAADGLPGADQRQHLVAGYERLREQVLGAAPQGWRLGWGVLACRGMAAWIAAWTTPATAADRLGTAAANAQALLPLSTPHAKGGEPDPACPSLPPAATAEIVTVLAAMTLAHAG